MTVGLRRLADRAMMNSLGWLVLAALPSAGAAHTAAADAAAAVSAVTPAGAFLTRTLDRMDVEHHWLRGFEHVAWRTGLELIKSHGKALTPLAMEETHCSEFAAAAADNLGIYLLHPPEYSHVLLANAQYDWLASYAGRRDGWRPAAGGVEAQSAANRGELVVAVFKNPDATHAGHIAVVRPCDKSAERIAAVGPQITQAGFNNYQSADLKNGFDHHPGAWPPQGGAGLKFYSHAVEAAKLAGE